MFRLRRIEKLLEEFMAIEKRVELIVLDNKRQIESERLIANLPWKCKKPGCEVEYWHLHTFADCSPPSGGADGG